MDKIRQLEKRCDREIHQARQRLNELIVEIYRRYSILIEVVRAEEPPIVDLEGYGKFLENLALGSIKIEADILAAKERINDITNEELHVYTKQDGIARG